ncbi:MAG: agmatine deiminase family protein, partial [Saprospiraceae bacterium]|nr:agmatine deiminase family protein [Saprospiraceae bacterium]
MKYVLFLLLLAVGPVSLLAQSLPRGFSEEEKQMMANGFFQRPKTVPGAITYRSPDDPPRSMAEWEEMQAIVITWTQYRSILAEIVRNAVSEVKVLIVNRDEQAARNYLTSRGIDPDFNIEYIDAEYNSIWVRDYGANPAYLGEVDSLVLVDWIYNRPRPDDDL